MDFKKLIDLYDLREPIEVYEAAVGNTEPLAKRLEEVEKFAEFERAAMSAYVRGQLLPPKRSRGQTSLPHLTRDTKEAAERLRIQNAVVLVRFIMGQLREETQHYGRFEEVLSHVSQKDGLSEAETERVVSEYKRGRKKAKNNPQMIFLTLFKISTFGSYELGVCLRSRSP